MWSNAVTKAVLDGWHLNGNGSIYAGTPYTVGCSRHRTAFAILDRHSDRVSPVPLPDGKQHLHVGRLAAFEDGRSAAAGSPEHRQLHASGGQLAGHRQHAADAVLRSVAVESRLLAGQDHPDRGRQDARTPRGDVQHAQPLQPEQPEHLAELQLHLGRTDQRELRHHHKRAGRSAPRGAVGRGSGSKTNAPDGRGSQARRDRSGNFWYCYKEWECEHHRL